MTWDFVSQRFIKGPVPVGLFTLDRLGAQLLKDVQNMLNVLHYQPEKFGLAEHCLDSTLILSRPIGC